MSKRRAGTPRHRPLRTWRVSFTCHIEPAVYSEGIEKYTERAHAEIDQAITLEVDAYTMNAAKERATSALQGLLISCVDKERR